jgi:PTH1 family peptidyl-tRNA hydrolase
MLEYWRKRTGKKETSPVKLIVGLGNPGREYAETRHNVGFMVISRMAEELGIRAQKSAQGALIGEGRLGGDRIILAQPQTYMNRSGEPVSALMRVYGLEPAELLVICDDLDLSVGSLRLKSRGGDGGHKGLRSIINNLGTNEFSRLRIGVGRPSSKDETNDYVLTGFDKDEQILLKEGIEAAVTGIRQWLFEGVEKAMNRVNVRKPQSKP